MTSLARLSLLVPAFWLLGCGEVGNGTISTEARTVDAFKRVSIASGIQATITLGTRDVSLTTDENILPLVETFLDGDTLVVRVLPDRVVTTGYGIRAAIVNDVLEGLSVSGGSPVEATATAATNFPISVSGGSQVKITAISATTSSAQVSGGSTLTLTGLAATTLTLDGSGGSTLTATGAATEVHLIGSGASHLDTDAVPATSLQLEGSGGSTFKARASGSARGALSGGSTATVSGGPGTRDVSLSGGSTVDWPQQ
jgi:hypothetical protein